MNERDELIYDKMARIIPTVYGEKSGDWQTIIQSGNTYPIVLSDVLNYINTDVGKISGTKVYRREIGYKLLKIWDLHRYKKSEPYYEQQSEECKEFISSLVK